MDLHPKIIPNLPWSIHFGHQNLGVTNLRHINCNKPVDHYTKISLIIRKKTFFFYRKSLIYGVSLVSELSTIVGEFAAMAPKSGPTLIIRNLY